MIEINICPICKNKTHVAIDRNTPYQRGSGCLTCGTAKEYEFSCIWKDCKQNFKRYLTEECKENNKNTKYCDTHFLLYIETVKITHVSYPEFVPQRIKDERVQFANDQIQSHRQGELSREFLEAHPKRAKQMLRDGVITKEDIKKSKRVWGNDIPGMTKKVDAEALIKE